jgi:hypothetical protein
MFILSADVTRVFVLVQSAGMPDEEADRLIEEAALRAADEVRTLAHQMRQTELDLMAYRKECNDRREVTAANNREWIRRQEQEGRDRNAILKAAEDINGPVRRGRYGLPHAS